jgi:hypothetical protein
VRLSASHGRIDQDEVFLSPMTSCIAQGSIRGAAFLAERFGPV